VLTDDDLDACAELADGLAHRATRRIVSDRPSPDQISTKTSAADWVTETDLSVERMVREALDERFPGHRVIGEEYGTTGPEDAPATWWIDPVDGTTNFVHGLPWSSFSLCVADEEGPAVAVVADPYRREVLAAIRGRGAWLDGRPTSCSEAQSLTGGIVLTEMVMQSLWPGQADVMQALADRGCVTRLMGSNALSLASVGAARCVATVIGGFNRGDCMGAMLIARESGAHVFARSDPPADGEPLVCAAPGVADELLALLPGTL
jgi:fructose-1,6-bisphosphatase/inositol monophosphatase family enzyme